MSNVEQVRQFYDLFKAGNKDYLKLCDDDIEWNAMEDMPNRMAAIVTDSGPKKTRPKVAIAPTS